MYLKHIIFVTVFLIRPTLPGIDAVAPIKPSVWSRNIIQLHPLSGAGSFYKRLDETLKVACLKFLYQPDFNDIIHINKVFHVVYEYETSFFFFYKSMVLKLLNS